MLDVSGEEGLPFSSQVSGVLAAQELLPDNHI